MDVIIAYLGHQTAKHKNLHVVHYIQNRASQECSYIWYLIPAHHGFQVLFHPEIQQSSQQRSYAAF